MLQSQVASEWFTTVKGDTEQQSEFKHWPLWKDHTGTSLQPSRSTAQQNDTLNVDQLVHVIEDHIHTNPETDLAIVIDDCHWFAKDYATTEKLDHLISRSPKHTHFVFIGRCIPALACSCYLALERQLAAIGSADLRFTQRESRLVLRLAHGRRISGYDLEHIARTSEGWVAAVVFGGIQLVSLNRESVTASTSQSNLVFDYLHNEVYSCQSLLVKKFLLASSLVDEFCPQLCDAILDSSGSELTIQYLLDHSVFLERSQKSFDNYRYHGLFLSFLRNQVESHLLDSSDSDSLWTVFDLRSLHLRASEWYRLGGNAVEHIRHIILSGDDMTAAEHVVDMLDLLYVDGGYSDFIRLVGGLPEDVLRHYPVILFRLAGAQMMTGDIDQALHEFDRAIEQLESISDNETLSKTLIGRSEPLQLIGELNAAKSDLYRALALTNDRLTMARAQRLMAQCMMSSNDFDQALDYLRESLDNTALIQAHSQTAIVHTDLSMLHHLQGRLDKATEHAMLSMTIWRDIGDIGNYALALNNLGTAHHAQGHLEIAEQLLRESCSLARSAGVWRYQTVSLISLADVLSDRGDLVEACSTYKSCIDLLLLQKPTSLTVYGMAMWADARRLRGDLFGASRLLIEAQSFALSSADDFVKHLIEYLQGVLALDELNTAHSARYLEKSVEGFISLGRLREAVRSAIYRVVVAHLTSDPDAIGHWIDVVRIHSSHENALLSLEVDVPRAQRYLDRHGGSTQVLLNDMLCSADTNDCKRIRLSDQSVLRASTNHAITSVLALGVPRVTRGGESIDGEFQTRSARDMLFYIIESRSGRSQDELMSIFWPNSTLRRAKSAMQTTLSRIRKVLGSSTVVLDGDRYFVVRGSGIRFDVDDFHRLVAQAESHDSPSLTIEILQAALRLVRGEYMDGSNADWVIEVRRKYDRLITRTLKTLADSQIKSLYWEDAIISLHQVIDREPSMESAYRRLMRAYVANGDRASALVVYSRLVDTLRQDLNVEPDPRSRALYQVIRERGDAL